MRPVCISTSSAPRHSGGALAKGSGRGGLRPHCPRLNYALALLQCLPGILPSHVLRSLFALLLTASTCVGQLLHFNFSGTLDCPNGVYPLLSPQFNASFDLPSDPRDLIANPYNIDLGVMPP